MGTKTYGTVSHKQFRFHFRFVVDEKISFFLVKMCDSFTADFARFHLPSSALHYPERIGSNMALDGCDLSHATLGPVAVQVADGANNAINSIEGKEAMRIKKEAVLGM